MVLGLVTAQLGTTITAIQHNIALFILIVGLVFFALALFGPQIRIFLIQVAMAEIAIAIAFFYLMEGSFFAFTPTVMEVLGFGIIAIVLGRMFGVSTAG